MPLTPQLFSLAADPSPITTPPIFDTPLGRLKLQAAIDGQPIAPDAAFAMADCAVIIWAGSVRIELLLTKPALSLPPGMIVAGATAAVWRVAPTRPVGARVCLRCTWTVGATWTEVGPESGENLDAQTWTDSQTKVTVGLPDLGSATAYRADGFEVAVEPGPAVFQTRFVCAWGPDVPDDVATWFAVDCTPAQALAGTS